MLTKTTIEERKLAGHSRLCLVVSLLVVLATFNPVSVAQNYQIIKHGIYLMVLLLAWEKEELEVAPERSLFPRW